MSSNALPPVRRLRRRVEFQRVFDKGRRTHGRFLTIIAAPDGGPCARLGIVASKKLGGAVDRNRAKRLIREVFRTITPVERPLDVVVIPKAPLLVAPFEAFERDFRVTLRRCQELSR
jgi:ribonuclease P protein component